MSKCLNGPNRLKRDLSVSLSRKMLDVWAVQIWPYPFFNTKIQFPKVGNYRSKDHFTILNVTRLRRGLRPPLRAKQKFTFDDHKSQIAKKGKFMSTGFSPYSKMSVSDMSDKILLRIDLPAEFPLLIISTQGSRLTLSIER